jgi:hypothetical protein
MVVGENLDNLRHLRLYRGELPPDSILTDEGDATRFATQGYGVGNWHLYNGRRNEGEAVLWRVVQAENWAPFGYIAAEADLHRMERRGRL